MDSIREFERNLMNQMQEEPPEIRRKVEENIWDLFGDEEEDESSVEISVTVDWSEEDGGYIAVDHNRKASAFAETPTEALRELATVIELYEEVED